MQSNSAAGTQGQGRPSGGAAGLAVTSARHFGALHVPTHLPVALKRALGLGTAQGGANQSTAHPLAPPAKQKMRPSTESGRSSTWVVGAAAARAAARRPALGAGLWARGARMASLACGCEWPAGPPGAVHCRWQQRRRAARKADKHSGSSIASLCIWLIRGITDLLEHHRHSGGLVGCRLQADSRATAAPHAPQAPPLLHHVLPPGPASRSRQLPLRLPFPGITRCPPASRRGAPPRRHAQ